MNVLHAHMTAVEDTLLRQGAVAATAGHPVNKGTPREAFIREFLRKHLSERVRIGQGEIFDHRSLPKDARRQMDIVLSRHDHPRLELGGGIEAYFIESVAATIEVKSTLDKDALRQAFEAAAEVKRLDRQMVRSFSTGYIPPGVLSYVVAYAGPANMLTVAGWVTEIEASLGLPRTALPTDDAKRVSTPSAAIDGIFILGKGVVYYDNAPIGFFNEESRKANPGIRWISVDAPSGALLFLFSLLSTALSGIEGAWMNTIPYLQTFRLDKPPQGIR